LKKQEKNLRFRGPGKINNCLYLCLQLTANLSILINPFLPATARKMLHMMKVVDRMLDWETLVKWIC
jgi:methionyl-tRNA synthetase